MRLLALIPNAFTALLLLTTGELVEGARKSANSVLLTNVQTLTLRKDAKTSHRRVPAVPQLKCVGGNAKGLYEVDVMRCTNSGSGYDESNVEWTCKAQLPPEFKLGSTEVICEGYDSPNDPYILKGSCGVEYRLILTDAGEEKYGKSSSWFSTKQDHSGGSVWDDVFAVVFWIIFLGIVAWILIAACGGGNGANNGHGQRRPQGGGGGGWWGGGDGNDPPPPYTPSYNPRPTRKTYSSPSSSESWRPGFWSGAAGGAAAGYMAGRMAGNNQNTATYQQGRGDSWFGGGNAAAGPSGSNSARRSDSDSSHSSARYESTGFGSTSRR